MYTSYKIDTQKLFDISMQSANSKEKRVFIFEIDDLWKFFSQQQSEEIRQEFLKNDIQVQQITNMSNLEQFSENSEFINSVMQFRYVPESIFNIQKEILIFDDIVAIYDNDELMILQDEKFAQAQKQFFKNIWKEGFSPKLNFSYTPNHSFYNSVDIRVWWKQMIIWPDADARDAYQDFDIQKLQEYMQEIYESDEDYFKQSSYFIVFMWSLEGSKMMDVWKFEDNHVDDRSWPLSEVRVYKDKDICNNIGLASGNTLLVLWYEEKLRRQSKSLDEYLQGASPDLPLEVMNRLDFFECTNK